MLLEEQILSLKSRPIRRVCPPGRKQEVMKVIPLDLQKNVYSKERSHVELTLLNMNCLQRYVGWKD